MFNSRIFSYFKKHSASLKYINRTILDIPYLIKEGPIHDELLSDINWEHLISLREIKKIGVFKKVDGNAIPKLFVSPTLRTLGMFPVTSSATNTSKWVPFILDTGSGQTYFNRKTVDELKLDISDQVLVGGVKCSYCNSGAHFEDINLLGTDILCHGDLLVKYPRKEASFIVTEKITLSNYLWVNVNNGIMFPVYVEQDCVAFLKEAVKKKKSNTLSNIDADELIVTEKSNKKLSFEEAKNLALDSKSKLKENVDYSVYVPKE